MVDITQFPKAISEVMKWFNSASARKKEQALRAADAYIDIDQTGLYQGLELSEKREMELKLHFSKRFNAWKRG